MKNSMMDLNNYLFELIERLNDDEIKGEALEQELKRADGITKIASQIIQNAELALRTMRYKAEYGIQRDDVPEMLEKK